MNTNIYKKTYILVVIVLLQFIASMISINKTLIESTGGSLAVYEYPHVLGFFIHALGMSSILWILYIARTIRHEYEFNKKLHNSSEIIDALKGQKHDFNNHMNVVAGLIQMNKTEKALTYLYEVCGKSNEIFSISKIENPEIAAIIYRKCAIAESNGINVELDIASTLDSMAISPVDLSKILFNLIDNAIYELERCNEQQKILSIDISEFNEQYIISIGNSYPVLSPDLYEKIWAKGFSTKIGSDRGYGLSIVKGMVEKNNGTIEVESYDGVGTIFTAFLPKKSQP